MNFTRLTKDNVESVSKYLLQTTTPFCDVSLGEKYMWRDEYVIDFAIIDDTLIMKESCSEYKDVFYFPMGKSVENALKQIENYCLQTGIKLEFCCIDDSTSLLLKQRYFDVQVFFERDWNDYIYTAEQFKTYAGKKLSGQRNHVNKFKKTYSDYQFKVVELADLQRVHEFLEEYKLSPHLTTDAREEVDLTHDYLDNVFRLNQNAGIILVEGKIVALSIGEVVGDTLIVHVEKALTNYKGAYPTMAQEFARAFAGQGVEFINREEDCGEEGLRTSKMQYHPVEIRNKNAVIVNTLFDRIDCNLNLQVGDIVIDKILDRDKQDYYRLYTDKELNKLWGYDYNQDIGDNLPTPEYFYSFMKGLEDSKEEISFAVRKDGAFMGELVLHNFDFYGGVEMGFRFFKEFQGKGYGIKSANALKDYLINNVKIKKLKCKCYKENLSSLKLIERLGLAKVNQDKEYYYFELKN